MITLPLTTLCVTGVMMGCGAAGDGLFAWLAGGAGELMGYMAAAFAANVAVPLPSSAMMGLALIGGALLFGRIRPRKTRRRHTPRR